MRGTSAATTRDSTWRFRLHRLAAGLGALALTVNAVLIAVMISADMFAYQTARAGIALHQWWLAPLGWPFIAGLIGSRLPPPVMAASLASASSKSASSVIGTVIAALTETSRSSAFRQPDEC